MSLGFWVWRRRFFFSHRCRCSHVYRVRRAQECAQKRLCRSRFLCVCVRVCVSSALCCVMRMTSGLFVRDRTGAAPLSPAPSEEPVCTCRFVDVSAVRASPISLSLSPCDVAGFHLTAALRVAARVAKARRHTTPMRTQNKLTHTHARTHVHRTIFFVVALHWSDACP